MTERSVELTTDGGLKLSLRLAGLPERALALVVDAFLLAFVAVPLSLGKGITDPWIPIAVAAFIVRHAYFVGLGARLNGATLGKQSLGIRVVALGRGPLTWRRLLVRSLVRDLELALPLVAVAGIWLPNGEPLWLAGATWIAAFALIPLVHPQRRRLADMIASTAVVRRPAVGGAPLSLVDPRSLDTQTSERPAAAVLGVEQMEVLARLLREVEPTTDAGQTVRHEVARTLASKLGRCPDRAAADADGFLRRLYAELASHYGREQRMGRTGGSTSP